MDFEQFYQDKYPAGVPREVDLNKYKSMVDVFEQSVKKFADRPAFSAVGATLTYRDLDTQSRNFAAWLQNKTDLKPGDRIAVQMPNVSQYPVVVFGAMRAGLIVVNTNPLYTTREMEHQFNDAGAKAIEETVKSTRSRAPSASRRCSMDVMEKLFRSNDLGTGT